jgi:tRNA(Ser,Leu) C12 N-acetylase TAN1
MKDFNNKINPAKSWKLDIVKRHLDNASITDMVLKLTEYIDKPKVDLKNAELVIRIEILGERAACSLLSADELLDTQKMR